MAKIDDKQIVYINSSNRLSGTHSNFVYQINLNPDSKFDRITLLQAGIPKSYYSTLTNYNYFTLTELGISVTIIVPIGSYTRTALAAVIGTLLTNASKVAPLSHNWTYTVTFPNVNSVGDTGLYTITVTNNMGNQPILTFDNVTLINQSIGFASGSTNNFVGSVLVSTQVVNLQPFNSIQIHSNLVANPFATGFNTDILQSVFANVGSAPFSHIQWICPEFESFSHNLSSSKTSIANFYITDETGLPIDTNGNSMQLVVMFWRKNSSLRLLTEFIQYATDWMQLFKSKFLQ